MYFRKIVSGLALSLLLGSGMVVAVDPDKVEKDFQSRDAKASLVELIRLAEQGSANAQFELGGMYEHGQGAPQSYKIALKWLTLAAEQGHALAELVKRVNEQKLADAQNNVGDMYDFGDWILLNNKIGMVWYVKLLTIAAEQGYAMAQFRLGVMYANGYGVIWNDNTAVKWYTSAAKQGDAMAQFNLGNMLRRGDGVLKDYLRAYMWYNIASHGGNMYYKLFYNGNEKASKYKNDVSRKLTPAELVKAQLMSSRCLESNYTDC